MNSSEKVQNMVQSWKSNLIDLSRRNRLLSFKPNATTLSLEHPNLDGLLHELLAEKSIQVDRYVNLEKLLATTKKSKETTIYLENIDEEAAKKRYAEEKVNKLLNNIRSKGKSTLVEKGFNSLFLFIGALKWRESSSKDETISPLLLVPITLARKSANHPFVMTRYDDEIVVNPVLCHYMKTAFDITLPEYSEEELEKSTLSEIFAAIQDSLVNKVGWEILEETCIGIFSFSKLVMYKDLEMNEEGVKEHSLVQRLAGIEVKEEEPFDPDLVSKTDRSMASSNSFQVLDADSSQLEAILQSKTGKSFVLHGPPGTGKSQTIANMIAEGLAQGKRVLFVSEKMAALQVVKKRLEDADLGSYLLDLHSHNANKKLVIDELDRAYKEQKKGLAKKDLFRRIDSNKKQINDYVSSLHQEVEPLGMTVFQAHGWLGKLYDVPELTFRMVDVGSFTRERLERVLELLSKLEQSRRIIDDNESHIWREAKVERFTFELQSDVSQKLSSFSQKAHALATLSQMIRTLTGHTWADSLNGLQNVLSLEALLLQPMRIPNNWLQNTFAFEKAKEEIKKVSLKFSLLKSDLENMRKRFSDGVLELDWGELEKTLTDKKDSKLIEAFLKDPQKIFTLLQTSLQTGQKLKQLQCDLETNIGLRLHSVKEENVQAIEEVAIELRNDPKAVSSWFDSEQHTELKNQWAKAKALFQKYHTLREQILQKYDEEVFHLDAGNLLERLTKKYGAGWQRLNPSYKKEVNSILVYRKEKRKQDHASLVEDLETLRKSQEKRREIEGQYEFYKKIFGQTFEGERTDFELLKERMERVFRIVTRERSTKAFENFLIRDYARLHQNLDQLKNELRKSFDLFEKTKGEIGSYIGGFPKTYFEETLEFLHQVFSELSELEKKMGVLQPCMLFQSASMDQWLSDLKTVRSICELRNWKNAQETYFKTLYGNLYHDEETDWELVANSIHWMGRLLTLFENQIPKEMLSLDVKRFMELARRVRTIMISIQQDELKLYLILFEQNAPVFEGVPLANAHLSLVESKLQQLSVHSFELEEWLHFKELVAEAKSYGMEGFIEDLLANKYEDHLYQELFLKRFYKLWLDFAYAQSPEVQSFRRQTHEEAIELFKQLDVEQLKVNRLRIQDILIGAKHRFINSREAGREVKLLRKQVQGKRHWAIRKLFLNIPNLLLALKPCLMMSPLSVAHYLDANLFKFDLVIFDEASQLFAEDAIGAIFRGKQLIVAGDSKQLPPNRFFAAAMGSEDDEEEEDTTEMFESILDECKAFLPEISLNWHYRSKDETLISFSNQYLYDNALYTFSNPIQAQGLGVLFVHVKEGLYERGGSATNEVEAKRVAELVIEHFKSSPNRSLGVIAFSQAQQNEILDQLEEVRKSYPELDPLFAEDRPEEFFVKNIDNVQGDERDSIILSVGYGFDQAGKLSHNFGPLSKTGGERRLNVAVTRAKYNLTLVASIEDTDLDDTKLTQKGSFLLKKYIYFAKHGSSNVSERGNWDGEFESDLVEDVYQCLTDAGLLIEPQVGCSNYKIDLCVKDPNQLGRFVLGIECDGRTYSSSKTARDRDRLRQEVLESLGWKIHRIWSQDWFKRKKEIVQEIVTLAESLYGASLEEAEIFDEDNTMVIE